MEYRRGTTADWPAITQMIGDSGYYSPTNAAEIGGEWIVAVHDGKIVGCIWAFVGGVQAYVDYWYVEPKYQRSRVAARLMYSMHRMLQQSGVRFTRGVIRDDNHFAIRLATAFGVTVDYEYALAYKELT